MKEQKMLSWIGEDTEVTVLFDVQPYRPAVWSGPLMCDETPAEVTVNQVLLGGIDIWPHLAEADKDLLHGRILNQLEEKV